MCCDITLNDGSQHNQSCCSGINAINLFTMGSRIGTATSITLSLSATTTLPLSSTRVSSDDLSATQFSTLSPASGSATGLPTPDNNTSATHGRTIAIAVSVSVGAVVLIIAGFLVYQRRQRRKLEKIYRPVRQRDEKTGTGQVLVSHELAGQRAQELPTSPGGLRQELSG